MNFIFDIGNVLIDFKPISFLQTLYTDFIDVYKLNEIIFNSIEWIKLDEGTITAQEACSSLCLKAPDYQERITKVMGILPDMLTPMTQTIELLPKIKKLGHRLYFLSNYHTELSRYIQDENSFFELFDGGVFSCDVHMLKPSAEIYQFLLEKYQLNPKDCVFFDDIEKNVATARKLGIHGVVFTDINSVVNYIESLHGNTNKITDQIYA